MAKVTEHRKNTLRALKSAFSVGEIVEPGRIYKEAEKHGFKIPYWITNNYYDNKVEHGQYTIPFHLLDDEVEVSDADLKKVAKSVASKPPVPKKEVVVEEPKEVANEVVNNAVSFIPEVDKDYVQFGNYKHIKNIIESKIFYPVFISGLSGNGKTFSVEQACAKLKRELVRVNTVSYTHLTLPTTPYV